MDNFDLRKYLAEGRLYENDGNIKFINKFNPPQEVIDYYDKNPFAKKPLSAFSRYKKNQIIQSLITHLSKGQVAYDLKLSKDDIFKYQNEDMVEIWADDYWKDSDFFTYGKYVDKDYSEFFNANKDLYPDNDLAEGKLYENDDAQRDALMAKVKGQHAKNVVQDGKFSRVNLFGSGDNKSKLVNVMDELRDEISYFKTPEEQDSDDYDDLMIDLKAAKEIARAVKEMGGKVEYGGKGLKYVYTVNGKGDLLGQAV